MPIYFHQNKTSFKSNCSILPARMQQKKKKNQWITLMFNFSSISIISNCFITIFCLTDDNRLYIIYNAFFLLQWHYYCNNGIIIQPTVGFYNSSQSNEINRLCRAYSYSLIHHSLIIYQNTGRQLAINYTVTSIHSSIR